MKEARREAFWGYERGERRFLTEMPAKSYGVIFQELRSGDAVGQYTLPLEGDSDLLLWKPVKEREARLQDEQKIEQVRRDLQRVVRV